MRITVKLFAAAREAAGSDTVDVELGGETVRAADVLAALSTRGDALGPVAMRSRLAVNQALAAGDSAIRAGDEVALIPPVGGG